MANLRSEQLNRRRIVETLFVVRQKTEGPTFRIMQMSVFCDKNTFLGIFNADLLAKHASYEK